MANTVSVSINLNHLRHNYKMAKSMSRSAQVFAVLKSDAYGHGLLNIARGLRNSDGFAVIQLEDALALRQNGFNQSILMMAGINDDRELVEACAHKLMLVVRSRQQLDLLCKSRSPQMLHVWIKVKSNINRFGFKPGDVFTVLGELKSRPNVNVRGLMMHFASADDLDCELMPQWESFQTLVRKAGLQFSAANSAAMLRDARTHGALVRAGSVLYGNNPFVGGQPFDALKDFRPVMRLEARLIATVNLAPGEPLGYGATFIADRRMNVGIVGCGYGDGYPANASTGTPVLLRDARLRILGKVAMNVIFVDLEPVPDAQVGEWVTLWGDERLRIDEVAQFVGLSSEAIQCGLTKKHHAELIDNRTLYET